MAATLFRHATLVDATETEAREGYDLLVVDGRIAEIADIRLKAPEGAREIDLKGLTLMPGLIDAHVHVKATRLDLAGLMATPVSYLIGQTAQIMDGMLMRGFTTVRDAAGADRGLADAVADGLFRGPRLFVCGLALSQTGGHSDIRPPTVMSQASEVERHNLGQQLGRIADGVDECRRAARDELRKGAHHVKIMAGGGVSSPSDPIENTQYSMEELVAICEEAAAWQTYTMAHTYTPAAIAMSVTAGVRTVEHCNLIDAETARLVAEKGAYHVPTNITYWALEKHGREFGFPEISIRKLKTITEAGLGAMELTRDAGVKIGFGTDLLGPCHRFQSNEFALSAEVLGPHGALAASLEVNAEILGMEGEIGRLAPGYRADLIVVEGNPLEDIACLTEDGAQIPLVMKDGTIFKDRLTT
ncbi:MAG: amidohydrolase family protein [Pseudomonadota bacterium]